MGTKRSADGGDNSGTESGTMRSETQPQSVGAGAQKSPEFPGDSASCDYLHDDQVPPRGVELIRKTPANREISGQAAHKAAHRTPTIETLKADIVACPDLPANIKNAMLALLG